MQTSPCLTRCDEDTQICKPPTLSTPAAGVPAVPLAQGLAAAPPSCLSRLPGPLPYREEVGLGGVRRRGFPPQKEKEQKAKKPKKKKKKKKRATPLIQNLHFKKTKKQKPPQTPSPVQLPI